MRSSMALVASLAAFALHTTNKHNKRYVVEAFHTTMTKATTATAMSGSLSSSRRGSYTAGITGSRRPFFTALAAVESSSAVSPSIDEKKEVQWVQDGLYRVRDCNRMPDDIRASLLPFVLDGKLLGKVRPAMADLLCRQKNKDGKAVFYMNDDNNESSFMTLGSDLTTFDARTSAVASVMERLRDQGVIQGWRDELYPVSTSFYEEPLLVMERAATPMLGVVEYGVHINGLVQQPDGRPPLMWIARRSSTKSKYPGMLDHVAAGGQPAGGISLLENVVKECMEEAGIPEHLTREGIRPAGAISYENYSSRSDRVTRAVMFNYDLILPPDFVPKPVDGEVEEFFLWSIDEILASLAEDYPDPIKPNCYLVIIDWLQREGYLSPEAPGYLDILRELRSGTCQ